MSAEGSEDERSEAPELNVLGGPLEPCGTDPVTGFFRDGRCSTGPQDIGSHTVCAVVTREFLEHQAAAGNDLVTPRPEWQFPGLTPGDRWCVVAVRWLQAHQDGAAAPVVLASTHERALDVIPFQYLREHAVDVPPDAGSLL
ncbi:MAG TPA: DUF2237 domain-containing protein [Nocardioidaceae bacterium]|nr:DUF2237 domain-containing protein [Nocardioidaceae bacterium]